MPSTAVRIPEEAYAYLHDLAESQGKRIGEVIEYLIAERKRRVLIDSAITELDADKLCWGGGEDGSPRFTLLEWLERRL